MDRFVFPQFGLAETTDEPFFDDANLVNCTFEDVQAEIGKLVDRSSGKAAPTS